MGLSNQRWVRVSGSEFHWERDALESLGGVRQFVDWTQASAVEVRKAIEDSGENSPPESSPPEPNRRRLPKFSECLPKGLLGLFAWHRDYDRSAAGVIRENPVIAGRGWILAGSEPIVIFGLDIGHFVEHFEELVPSSSRRSLLQSLPAGKLFLKRGQNHVINGQMLRVGNLPRLPVKIFRDVYADSHFASQLQRSPFYCA
jgi:hypothetical protein